MAEIYDYDIRYNLDGAGWKALLTDLSPDETSQWMIGQFPINDPIEYEFQVVARSTR